MSTFTLAISPVWPLPICLDSWTWHSRFLCKIALYSIGPCIYHQSHPQLGVVFALVPSLHSSRVISPLISSSILGTQWPGKSFFQYPIILPFHSVHGVLQARILKRFAIPFSSGPHSVRPLHHDPSWVALGAWLSLIDFEKAMVLVWLDWLAFCEYGFSVSYLWCPLPTPTILLTIKESCSVVSDSLRPHGLYTTSLFLPWEPHEQYEKAKW